MSPPASRTRHDKPQLSFKVNEAYWFKWTEPGTRGFGEYYGGKVVHIVQNRVTWIWYDTEEQASRSMAALQRQGGPAISETEMQVLCADSSLSMRRIRSRLQLQAHSQSSLQHSQTEAYAGSDVTMSESSSESSEQLSSHPQQQSQPESRSQCSQCSIQPGNHNFTGFYNSANVSKWTRTLDRFFQEFDPRDLLIRLPYINIPTGVRSAAHRLFTACVSSLLNLVQQHIAIQDSILHVEPTYDKLYALLACLPLILLRWDSIIPYEANIRIQETRCKRFLRGEWLQLWQEAIQDAQSRNQQAERRLVSTDSQMAQKRLFHTAKQLVEAGNIGRARRLLVSPGLSNLPPPEIARMLRELNPDEDEPQEILCDGSPQDSFDWITGQWLTRMIRGNKRKVGLDLFGWSAKETWEPLLRDGALMDDFAQLIFKPMALGYIPAQYRDLFAGGRLVALAKPNKNGVRPICIGSVWRRILGKGLVRRRRAQLDSYFLTSHPRALQFCAGHVNGSTKLVQLIRAAVQAAREGQTNNVIISLDVKNAFNCMSRAHFFRTLKKASAAEFSEFIPYVAANYAKHSSMRYYAAGKVYTVLSRTGFHQGDPLGSTFFAFGLHDPLIELVKRHEDILALAFADNVHFIGELQRALLAAADFKLLLAKMGLKLNDNESLILTPGLLTAAQFEEGPFKSICQEGIWKIEGQGLSLQWRQDGIEVLGAPIGTRSFEQQVADNLLAEIASELDKVAQFPYHHHRAKIVTYSTNARFNYFARTWPRELGEYAAQAVDTLMDSFLQKVIPKPAASDIQRVLLAPSQTHPRTRLAIEQIRLNLTHGGWGLRSHKLHLDAAVYSSTACFLRWMRTRTSISLQQFLGAPYEHGDENDLVQFQPRYLTGSQESMVPIGDPITVDLIFAIKELEATKCFQFRSDVPTSTDDQTWNSSTAHGDSPTTSTLPSLVAILEWPKEAKFPQQHHISHFLSQHAKQDLMQKLDSHGRHRLEELQRKSWPQYDRNSTVAFCDSKCTKRLNVTPRCLMALTTCYYLNNRDFDDIEGFYLGLEIQSLRDRRTLQNLDEHGDKALASSVYVGCTRCMSHDNLADFIATLVRKSGLRYVSTTPHEIPRSSPDTEEHGDIYFKRGLAPTDSRLQYVSDVTMGHPFSGAGFYESGKLQKLESDKNRKYYSKYLEQNILFFPLVCSSFGNIGPDFARFLYRLAIIQSTPPQHLQLSTSQPSPTLGADLEGETDDDEMWSDGPTKGVRYSWLVKDAIHQITLATLLRLRGRDEVASVRLGTGVDAS